MQGGSDSSVSAFADWDEPFTEQELQAVDAAFHSATSSFSQFKKRQLSVTITTANNQDGHHAITTQQGQDRRKSFRSLPDSFSFSACPRRRFYNSSRQDKAKLMMSYPTMTFRGKIVYGRTTAEVEEAAEELIKFVEAKKKEGGKVILGFDIEWKPTFQSGVPPGKAAVMQICGSIDHCYVLHIIHSGIPQNLQSLLEDSTSVKVGVWIMNDAVKLFKDYSVSVEDLEDLSALANQKLGGESKNWSLASLTEMLICKQLPKPAKIRLGNWEADILSKEQLQYAATDAFASWYLYQALKGCARTAKDNNENEGNSAS